MLHLADINNSNAPRTEHHKASGVQHAIHAVREAVRQFLDKPFISVIGDRTSLLLPTLSELGMTSGRNNATLRRRMGI